MTLEHILSEPRIHVRMRDGVSLAPSEDRSSFVVSSESSDGPVSVGPYRPEYEDANHLLRVGAPLVSLRDNVSARGDAALAASYVQWLERLSDRGLIEYPLVTEGVEHAVIVPQRPSFVPSLSADVPANARSLDRFALLRRQDGSWVLESPLVGARFLLADLDSLDRPAVRCALSAAGFLDASHAPDDPGTVALAQWEFHDLLMHHHHRGGRHRDPIGATFPFIGEIDPLPARGPAWPGPPIPLPSASPSSSENSFSSVLERRRSERTCDPTRPITLDALGALLDRAARARELDSITLQDSAGRSASYEISFRPYPSAGSCYELEIYPPIARCEGLDPGLYHYDSVEHQLVRISGSNLETDMIVFEASNATSFLASPQVVLIFAARFARVTWKYRALAYGLILRNLGALCQTLYLAATELELSPCAIGYGNAERFARLTGLDPVVEGSVGEFVLGGKALPSRRRG